MSHFVLVTLHLFAATMFVGTVFFEVLILEGIRKPVGARRCVPWKPRSTVVRAA
jgi:hypothetical protein